MKTNEGVKNRKRESEEGEKQQYRPDEEYKKNRESEREEVKYSSRVQFLLTDVPAQTLPYSLVFQVTNANRCVGMYVCMCF